MDEETEMLRKARRVLWVVAAEIGPPENSLDYWYEVHCLATGLVDIATDALYQLAKQKEGSCPKSPSPT